MSFESKVYAAFTAVFRDIEERKKELREIKSDVILLMDKSRSELDKRTIELSSREKWVKNAEDRINESRRRQFAEFEREKQEESERVKADIDRARETALSFVRDEIERFKELLETNEKLSDAYINALFYADSRVVELMRNKRPANLNAADTISGYKKELRELRIKLKDLEYVVDDSIWNETDEKLQDFEQADEDEDTVTYFLSKEEYQQLSITDKNQLALDRFLKRKFSNRYIGLMYERLVGHIFETDGYDVTYRGAELGKKDGGIDLVCKKPGETLFVQCKNWSGSKIIHENYLCQLYGSTHYYSDNLLAHKEIQTNEPLLFDMKHINDIIPVFVTTTNLDEHAMTVAKYLGIKVIDDIPFTRDYPMIKCNINSVGEKIYHLPFDQMYDKVKINKKGEFYAWTVSEAESQGFRRAFRWHGNEE